MRIWEETFLASPPTDYKLFSYSGGLVSNPAGRLPWFQEFVIFTVPLAKFWQSLIRPQPLPYTWFEIEIYFKLQMCFLPCGRITTTIQHTNTHITNTQIYISQNNTTIDKQTRQRKTNHVTTLQKQWRTYYSQWKQRKKEKKWSYPWQWLEANWGVRRRDSHCLDNRFS
jgi:hypothetical protein